MKVLQLIWVDAAWHPVVVFTTQLLAERGDVVNILYRFPDSQHRIPGSTDFGQNVILHSWGRGHSGWRNQVAYVGFLLNAFNLARRFKPDVVIGYDMHGIVAAYCARSGYGQTRMIYHNLDLAAKDVLSAYGRLVKRFEAVAAQSADLTIFSSPGRAMAFKQEVRLKQEPRVVMNCQRRTRREAKTGELAWLLHSRGLSFDRLVIRLGSLGPQHAIEVTIRSVPHWAGNWGLILAGVPIPAYLAKLENLVEQLDLSRKVVILPSVPYSLWYDSLYSADLGIALYEPDGNINHLSMAGAGNKLNLYLKAGIPSLVPDIPDFVQFVERYEAGVVVSTCEPTAIANAVNAALADPEQYAALCRNARLAFETEFNFETQFAPIMSWLEENFAG